METNTNKPSDSYSAPDANGTDEILDGAREKCQEAIDYGFSRSNPVLIDALPAMGKTTGVFEWAKRTGNPRNEGLSRWDHLISRVDPSIEQTKSLGLNLHPMPRFEEGDRVRIDIPDTTDPDFDAYHGATGTVISVLQDEAGEHTGDDRDGYLYHVDVDDGQEIDLRWRDLRPLSMQSE